MSAHTIELDVTLKNDETAEEDDNTVSVDLTDGQLAEQIQALQAEVTDDALKAFLAGLYGNSEMDGSPSRGVAFDHLLARLTGIAYDDLGWHSVMALVKNIRIDGEAVDLTDEQRDDLVGYDLSIQLVRDGPTMYMIGV